MLVQLSIRDIVLIDRLDIEPGAGLTVLTGETGAGKSILLDAFALALGGRGDGALVRAGQVLVFARRAGEKGRYGAVIARCVARPPEARRIRGAA